MFCPQCGAELVDDVCPKCTAENSEAQSEPEYAEAQSEPEYTETTSTTENAETTSEPEVEVQPPKKMDLTLAIVCLATGIASLVWGFIPSPLPLAIPAAIAALITGYFFKKKYGVSHPMVTAGYVCAIIKLGFWAVVAVISILTVVIPTVLSIIGAILALIFYAIYMIIYLVIMVVGFGFMFV